MPSWLLLSAGHSYFSAFLELPVVRLRPPISLAASEMHSTRVPTVSRMLSVSMRLQHLQVISNLLLTNSSSLPDSHHPNVRKQVLISNDTNLSLSRRVLLRMDIHVQEASLVHRLQYLCMA